MKIRQLHPEVYRATDPPSQLLVTLRHKKLKINVQLRWCSITLVLAYILIITSGTQYSNQVVSSFGWVPFLMIGLFVLLLICLFLVQYPYTDKGPEKNDREIKLPVLFSGKLYQTSQRLIGVTIITVFITTLITVIMLISDRKESVGFIMLSALFIYFFGLFITKTLLLEKCTINRLINKFRFDA